MIRQEEGSGEHVLKFPDVPRPRIGKRAVKRGERETLGRFVRERCLLVQKVLNEQRNIGTPFLRAESKLKNVQTIEQILAEFSLLNDLAKIGVGRRYDADVGMNHLLGADLAVFTFLQEPKKLHLRVACQTIHLIEEERPALTFVGSAPDDLNGASECASLVTEDFALHEMLRDGTAIHRNKGQAGPRAQTVNSPRENFLAGAGLP